MVLAFESRVLWILASKRTLARLRRTLRQGDNTMMWRKSTCWSCLRYLDVMCCLTVSKNIHHVDPFDMSKVHRTHLDEFVWLTTSIFKPIPDIPQDKWFAWWLQMHYNTHNTVNSSIPMDHPFLPVQCFLFLPVLRGTDPEARRSRVKLQVVVFGRWS